MMERELDFSVSSAKNLPFILGNRLTMRFARRSNARSGWPMRKRLSPHFSRWI